MSQTCRFAALAVAFFALSGFQANASGVDAGFLSALRRAERGWRSGASLGLDPGPSSFRSQVPREASL
jgi:hypothetical protein